MLFKGSLCPSGVVPEGSDHKELPAVQTYFWSLGWENPLAKRMVTHPSILACRPPWTEEPGGLQSMGSQRVQHDRVTNTFTSTLLHPNHSSVICLITTHQQQYTCAPSLSRVQLFAIPWTIAHQAALSVGFPKQEHWKGCHFVLWEIFPTLGSNPHLLLGRRILYYWAPR